MNKNNFQTIQHYAYIYNIWDLNVSDIVKYCIVSVIKHSVWNAKWAACSLKVNTSQYDNLFSCN
jgi:hypothetical protein